MAPNYERLPQNDDALSLHTVSDSYNYGTGIVTSSPPPSFHSSANIRPPSFYTSSRVLGSNTTNTNSLLFTPPTTDNTGSCGRSPAAPLTSNALASLQTHGDPEPQPHAPPPSYHPEDLMDTRSLAGTYRTGAHTPTPSDALAHNLHKRITRLEEALGRVMLQNEQLLTTLRTSSVNPDGTKKQKRANCCVSIADDERGDHAERDNCCVSIGRARTPEEREREFVCWALLAALVVILGFVAMVVWAKVLGMRGAGGSGGGGEEMVGKVLEGVSKPEFARLRMFRG